MVTGLCLPLFVVQKQDCVSSKHASNQQQPRLVLGLTQRRNISAVRIPASGNFNGVPQYMHCLHGRPCLQYVSVNRNLKSVCYVSKEQE